MRIVEELIDDAKFKAMNGGLDFIGLVDKSEKDGFAIVDGDTDVYKVRYKWNDDHDTMYGYDCSCPHNTYRDIPCKHMFKVENELDNFKVVK